MTFGGIALGSMLDISFINFALPRLFLVLAHVSSFMECVIRLEQADTIVTKAAGGFEQDLTSDQCCRLTD